jgi:hypothetical protein
VVGYSTELHNCDRAGLQRRELVDGAPDSTTWFDTPQLELVQASVLIPAPTGPVDVHLGDKVADTLSDLKGSVTTIVTFFNGCTRLAIQPDKLKDGIPVEEAWMPAQRVKVLKRAKQAVGVNPGGPMKATRFGMRDPR